MFVPSITPFYLLLTCGLFGIVCWGVGYEMGRANEKILEEEIRQLKER